MSKSRELETLAKAEEYLLRAAAGQNPLTFVNYALTAIGELALTIDLATEFPTEAASVRALIEECTLPLVAAVGGKIDQREIRFAMEAATSLLSGGSETIRRECLIYAGLLKLELTRLVLVEQLAGKTPALASLLRPKPLTGATTVN